MVLVIGNFLTKHGYNPTFIETLTKDLTQCYKIQIASEKKNQLFRFIDMFFQFYLNLNKTNLIIIDLYSTRAYYFGLFFSFLSKMHQKPFLLILSGGDLKARYNKSPSFKFILNFSTFNISPSIYLHNIFKKLNYKTEYIPNYIDLELYPYKKRTNIKPSILWVRAIHKIYNPEMAIKVLEKLITKYPSAKLCMVGPFKDSSINNIKNMINDYGIHKHVIITGKLNKEEWVHLSQDYDLFINTTDFDNHPVTLLEAMALGMPIVSTNAGGVPFLIEDGETGLLVEKNDHIGMAEKIHNLISGRSNAYDISLKARSVVIKLDKKLIIPKWNKVIDNIID